MLRPSNLAQYAFAMFIMSLPVLIHPSAARAQSAESGAASTLPRLIQYSGQLPVAENASGSGLLGVTFSLYSGQQDATPEWLETQNVPVDAAGRFSVNLGATSPEGLPQELFSANSARWLGVRVNQPAAAEQLGEQPRVLLLSVPYAMKAGDAETLGGLPASAFMLQPDALAARVGDAGGVGVALGDVLPSAAVTGTGTANRVTKWTDDIGTLADSSIFDNGSGVGINTTAPATLFHVARDSNAFSDTLSAMMVSNATTPAKRLMFGYDATLDAAYLQSTQVGVNVKPLLLNPVGGAVGMGTTSPQATMHVAQDSAYTSDAAAALLVSHRTTPAKRLLMGYDATIDAAYLQATQTGVNVKPIVLNPAGGNVGIGTTTPTKKLDVVGDVSVASGGTFIGPPGMLLTHASFGTALGYDSGTATMLAGDGGMQASTGATAGSIDDTVGGVIDVTDLAKTADIATGLSRTGAFLSARARWRSTINGSHVFYVLAGGAGTSEALCPSGNCAIGTGNGVKNGFGFKAVGSSLYGFTVASGSSTTTSAITGALSQNTWVDLFAVRRGSTVHFYAYSSGSLLGSTSTTSNLPSTAGSTYEVRTETSAASDAMLQVAYLTTGMPY